MGRLEGKTALVTGGNSGIGLATAKQFVNVGAYVFITRRRDAELTAAVSQIGKNVTGIQGDVSNLADLDRLFGLIKREKGKLDIVFANAGAAKYARFGAITEELYESIMLFSLSWKMFESSTGSAASVVEQRTYGNARDPRRLARNPIS